MIKFVVSLFFFVLNISSENENASLYDDESCRMQNCCVREKNVEYGYRPAMIAVSAEQIPDPPAYQYDAKNILTVVSENTINNSNASTSVSMMTSTSTLPPTAPLRGEQHHPLRKGNKQEMRNRAQVTKSHPNHKREIHFSHNPTHQRPRKRRPSQRPRRIKFSRRYSRRQVDDLQAFAVPPDSRH